MFWLMGLFWFGFSLMGYGTFVLIFVVSLFWFDFGTKISFSILAFWAKRPEYQGLNHCKFMYKFVNLVFFFFFWQVIHCDFFDKRLIVWQPCELDFLRNHLGFWFIWEIGFYFWKRVSLHFEMSLTYVVVIVVLTINLCK